MKTLCKKFKNAKLSTKLVYITTILIFLFGYIYLFINLLKLEGVETNLRILGLTGLGVLLIIYIFLNLILLLKRKGILVYIGSLFMVTISAFCIVGSNVINRLLNSFDELSKDTVIYTTNLISLSGTEFNDDATFITGVINNETDIEGNVLAYELINKDKLKIKIQKYDSYFEMLEDLYAKKIQGMFITSNYGIMYSTYEKYQNIKDETKVIKELSKEMKNQDYIENFADVTKPFTILVMGVDSEADTLKKASSFNGDTLMLIAFNPKTLNATVFSIPRDTYVPIACLNDESKINSAGAYGTKCVINTVQNLTNLTIDYYVKVDFQGVIDLVNAIGGVDIDVEVPTLKSFLKKYDGKLCESDAKRNMVNLVCMDTGMQHLNGEQALAYARNRYGYADGDFARNRHQQQIVEGLAKGIKNVSSVNDFYSILDTITPNIDTNMQTKEMLSLYGVAKNALQNNNGALINIQRTYLTGYDLIMYVNNIRANVYTYQYYPQSLQEIVDAMNETLEKKKVDMITTFSFSANKEYKVPVIGQRYYSVERNETIPNFKGQTQSQVKAWCDQRNIEMNVKYIREGDELFDDSLEEGTVVDQSVIKGKLVKDTSTITISVITKYNPTTTTTTSTTTTTITTTSKKIEDDNNTSDDNNNNSNDNNQSNEGGNTQQPDNNTTPPTDDQNNNE